MTDEFTIRDFMDAEGVENWRVISEGASAFYATRSLAESAELVAALARIDGIASHPPSIDIRHDGVTVRFITRSAEGYGLKRHDLDLAREVERVANEHGLTADPSAIQSLLVIPGWTHRAEIMPFWQAILGYEPRIDSPDEDLVDPHERDAGMWFEEMDAPRADGKGAIHIAVWVPREKAQERIDAAVAAGGRIVHDANAPSWVTLEDPAGNQVDVATVTGRA